MLKQPDAADFIHAMIKYAGDHESRDNWDVAFPSVVPHTSDLVTHGRQPL